MNYLWAFVVGGAICVVGQLLIDLTAMTPARILVSYVVAGVVLSALGLYEPLAKFAGAGCIVPITGFANAMVAPAIEYKAEGPILGVGAKLFSVAGPVLVCGITASVIVGVIHWMLL